MLLCVARCPLANQRLILFEVGIIPPAIRITLQSRILPGPQQHPAVTHRPGFVVAPAVEVIALDLRFLRLVKAVRLATESLFVNISLEVDVAVAAHEDTMALLVRQEATARDRLFDQRR